MSPRRKQEPPKFGEVFQLNSEEQKRLEVLVRYSKYRNNLGKIQKIQNELVKEINYQNQFIEKLKSVPEPQKNKMQIYKENKKLAEKMQQLEESKKEISTLKKYSISGKPDKPNLEIKELMKGSRVVTNARFVFVTTVNDKKGRLKFDYEFGITGRASVTSKNIKSDYDALQRIIDVFRKIRDEWDGQNYISSKTPILNWRVIADVQTQGQANPAHFALVLDYVIDGLQRVSRLPKLTEKKINEVFNAATKNQDIVIRASYSSKFKVYKKYTEEMAVGPIADKVTRKITRERSFVIPGEKSTDIDINGGIT